LKVVATYSDEGVEHFLQMSKLRDQLLDNLRERLEDSMIVDRSEMEHWPDRHATLLEFLRDGFFQLVLALCAKANNRGTVS